ncbi:MAG: hypothetical protein SCK57_10630 [Bacillota bacterium]|nr:hypothetical protein [Bacillota bacterium]MDW7678105.1 hypothetical protein [Bacillota bacterium]
MIHENTLPDDLDKIMRQCPPDTVIGEFAGRDSVAAILKGMEQPEIHYVLPVVTFAPVEYGAAAVLEENYQQLLRQSARQFGEQKSIGPLIYWSSQPFWQVLNGPYMARLQRRYGFYTPCIACHAYFHLVRMPLARQLGQVIISGERESHDGRLKANQLGICLDSYQRIISHFGVDLLIPLRHIKNGSEVESLIGWEWAEGEAQPQCLFSGNERDAHGRAMVDNTRINVFLDGFLEPVCKALGTLLLEKPEATLQDLKRKIDSLEEIL